MAYPADWSQEELFGLGYPTSEGTIASSAAEHLRMDAIARVLAANAGALGVGIYSGGDATIGATGVDLTAVVAIIQDALGWAPIAAVATTILATEFGNGTSYVHLQAGETARDDGGCGYYVSTSDTPAAGAVRVCSVTKAGGVITAVDNSARQSPAIIARLPWAELVAEYGGSETLLERLTAALGATYLGATPPSDLDARVTALEGAGVGGGGGGGYQYWGDYLLEAAGVNKTIRQGAAEEAETVADAAIAAHEAELHGSSSSGGGTAVAAEQWDVVAVNELRLAAATAHYLPTVPATLADAIVVVDGHCGSEYVDAEHSTF